MDINDLKNAQKELKKILSDWEKLSQIDLKKVEGIIKFEKKLQSLSIQTAEKQFQEWLDRTSAIIKELNQIRHDQFRRNISEFIRKIRENKEIREMSSSWRIGSLLLELNLSTSMVRFLYNNAPLDNKWLPVLDANDLMEKYSYYEQLMRQFEIKEDNLLEIFSEAYDSSRSKLLRANNAMAQFVPLRLFFEEVAVSLFRLDRHNKTKLADLPFWAFLYNLDRYTKIARELSLKDRLTLQDGSQQEVGKFGVCVNGLDAMQDYKMVTYIFR